MKVLHLFLYGECVMFKWLADLFKDNRCKCRGCEITRSGCGYQPCAGFVPPEVDGPENTSTNPPRKP